MNSRHYFPPPPPFTPLHSTTSLHSSSLTYIHTHIYVLHAPLSQPASQPVFIVRHHIHLLTHRRRGVESSCFDFVRLNLKNNNNVPAPLVCTYMCTLLCVCVCMGG